MVSAEKSQELGCDTGDIRCLCLNQNFIFGIRDCSLAICPGEDASAALQYALDLCKGMFLNTLSRSVQTLTF